MAKRNTISTEQAARIAAAHEEACAALRTNCCPTCNGAVRRNYSITGWVQCAQYGAATHRADANREACSWQGFTQ